MKASENENAQAKIQKIKESLSKEFEIIPWEKFQALIKQAQAEKRSAMCPHDKFVVVCYQDGVMIRKCQECGLAEVRTEYWVDFNTIAKIINDRS